MFDSGRVLVYSLLSALVAGSVVPRLPRGVRVEGVMAGRVRRSRLRAIHLLMPSLMLVWTLMAAVPVAAQGTGGVITGTIKDVQGGVLPGVSLTIRNAETGG